MLHQRRERTTRILALSTSRFLGFVRAFLLQRTALVAENLVLRPQTIVLQRSMKRPPLRKRDRIFWVWLSRFWAGWRSCLMIVKPETVIGWHREGFRLY